MLGFKPESIPGIIMGALQQLYQGLLGVCQVEAERRSARMKRQHPANAEFFENLALRRKLGHEQLRSLRLDAGPIGGEIVDGIHDRVTFARGKIPGRMQEPDTPFVFVVDSEEKGYAGFIGGFHRAMGEIAVSIPVNKAFPIADLKIIA